MQDYIPPIEDYRFLLAEVLGFDAQMQELGMEVDADLATAVLEEAGKLCAGTLHPLNRSGDEEGSHLVDGAVKTPEGFLRPIGNSRQAAGLRFPLIRATADRACPSYCNCG